MEASPTHKQRGRNERNDLGIHTIQTGSLESPSLESPSRSVSPEADNTASLNISYTKTKVPKAVLISIQTLNESKFKLARGKRLSKFLEASGEL